MAARLFLGLTDSGQRFTLPPDLVSQSTAILAKRRVGKSYLASVIAEELLARGQPVVIVDPTGAHWGLRASADGKKPGFPIVVIGGKHADLPLEEGGGEELARAIVEQRFSAIIDTSLLTKGATLRFLDRFLGALYQLNEKNLLLLLDEVDYYCPQKPASPQHAITAAHVDDLVRRGGIKGIGVVLVTQRSAVVSKDVLTQCEVLIALRLVHPLDLKPIMDWVGVHGDQERAKKMLASLPALPVGTAWVWWPAEEIFERIQVRLKSTFDSGRTPKPGERGAKPRVLAKVDLAQLGDRMKAAAEQAKANDPRELKKQLAAARDRIKALEARKDAPAPKAAKMIVQHDVKTVRVPALQEARMRNLEKLLKGVGITAERALKELLAIGVAQAKVLARLEKEAEQRTVVSAQKPEIYIPKNLDISSSPPQRTSGLLRHAPVEGELTGPEQRILDAIFWWEALNVYHPAAVAVAPLADYSVKSSGFEKARGMLKVKKLLAFEDGKLSLTPEGRRLARGEGPPPTTLELHRRVLETLTDPEKRVLDPLLRSHPEALSFEQLAVASNYSIKTSGFEKTRGMLRSKGLIEVEKSSARASAILFPNRE